MSDNQAGSGWGSSQPEENGGWGNHINNESNNEDKDFNPNQNSNNQFDDNDSSETNYGNQNNDNRSNYSSHNNYSNCNNEYYSPYNDDYDHEDPEYGFSDPNDDNFQNDRNGYGNQERNDQRGERSEERKGDDNADGGENNGAESETVKKIEFYIPPELGNEESEVFSSGITTGINFKKFDDIKVEVNGDNIPNVISSFEDVNLRPYLMHNIKRATYTKPTPIQRYSLSVVMAGRDLMACAQTGSGKTAAFLLPIINDILENSIDLIMTEDHVEPQAIVISPTRELAIQIYTEARKFSYDTGIKVSLVYGGASTNHQRRSLDQGCHILIGTPGRMLDFVNKGWVTYSSIKFVVLDEADRMLSMGFLPAMREMFEHPTMVPTGQRRTLMFSATFPREIQNLAAEFLHDYIFVTVGIIGSACSDIEQVFIQVEQSEKRPKLLEVLNNFGTKGTLIFVETKRNADFLAIYLSEQNYKINSIHGDRSQREREESIRDFKTGKCDILVATSVAARGLDIPNVRHVINFDLPVSDVEDYIHRIGRTGRIGNKGKATSFYNAEVNARNAEGYARILEQAEQDVPDWLRSGNRRNYYNRSRPSFGGRDMRRNNHQDQDQETSEEI